YNIMSIKYGFYKTPVPNDREDKQEYHARFIANGRTEVERLSQLIEATTKFNASDIKGILVGFIFAMRMDLEAGFIIQLEGIGTFYPTLATQTIINEDGTTEQVVKVKSVGFRCNKKLRRAIQDVPLERVKHVKAARVKPHERENKILAYLKEHVSISIKEVMRLNHYCRERARKDINKLLEEKKIIKIGGGNQVLYILPYPETPDR
ncbi:MAG: DeoR family transcriptional regulator, partial [Tannerellaceae bacterium]|nr:DeoR family transcriptional regulator [Tannerellaceae bacterium]